ncbi:MAG: HU family DNA-binding protein, partial [Bdellovibrionota bacterium]
MAKAKSKSTPTVSTSALMTEVSVKFQDIPKKVTKEVLQYFLNSIEEHVVAGAKVRIDKLGILHMTD